MASQDKILGQILVKMEETIIFVVPHVVSRKNAKIQCRGALQV